MPRGIDSSILSALSQTKIEGLLYLVKLTLKSGVKYWGERALTYDGHDYTARVMHISDLTHGSVSGNSNEVEIDLANVDGLITTLDRAESFLGAKVEIIEYIASLDLGYVKWAGWSDEVTEIDLLTAKLRAYAGPATSGMETPRRTISTQCQWEFANDDLYVSGTEYDGAECPYQRVSTVGFTTTTTQSIDDSTDPVTFNINALPNSQLFRIGDEIKIDNEILFVSIATSTSVTAFRAQRGTVIASHSSGATITFTNCHYSVAACKRRGMYGNNPSDTYGGTERNYFGGFPLLTGQITGRFREKTDERARIRTITFAGSTSAYGRPLPLIYGRCRLYDPTLIVARPEGDFLLSLFAVAEGILGTNPSDSSQVTTLDAYTKTNGAENIFVNGARRHDPRANFGVQVFNGQMDQPAPAAFTGIEDFSSYHLGMWGTAWVCLRISIQNNPQIDPSSLNVSGDFEVAYGKCVRVYSAVDTYTFKPCGSSPVWALLDYMTSKRTGGGTDHNRINIQSFLDVETYRSQTVTNIVDGENATRWTFNGAIDNRRSYSEHEKSICLGMYCLPPYMDANGKLKIRALKSETLTDLPLFSSVSSVNRNIIVVNGISSLKRSRQSLLEVPNEIRVNFVALEAEGWIKTQLVLADRELQRQIGKILGDGSLRVISKSLDLPGTTTVDEAARIGTLILRAGEFANGGSINNLRITFDTFYRDSQNLEIGDIIQVEDTLLDGVTESYFRIVKIEDRPEDLDNGGFLYKRKITATLHSNSIYDDTAYTCSLISRLDTSPSANTEPPAVTNFVVTESGIFDVNGTPHSKLVFTYTEPGEFVGAIDNVGGYAQNSTLVHMNGVTVGTVLKTGDKFLVAGHTTEYIVTAGCTFVDDSADVSFTPGLEAAVADNDVCTIIVYGEDTRGSFKDVAIFRSMVEDDGVTVIGDWRFVTICKKSGAFTWYDISNRYECFVALSRNLADNLPSIETKTENDTYKYPRQIIKVDGIMDDAGNPSGASNLELINSDDDSIVPAGSGYFKFNRETTNYKSILGVMVTLQPGSNDVAHGPYAIERTTFPSDVIESGNNCLVDAGNASVVIGGGRSSNNDTLSRALLVYTDDADPDSNLDGQVISSQNNNGFGLTTPFQKSGNFTYKVVKRWWDAEDSDNVKVWWFPINTIVPSLGAMEQVIWQTPIVQIPAGIWKATAYSRNVFGVGTRLVTAEAKEISSVTGKVPDQLVTYGYAVGLICFGAVRAKKYSDGIYEAEFRAKWFAEKQDYVDLRTVAEGGTLTHNGDTEFVVTGLGATKAGRTYKWGDDADTFGVWYFAFRLKNAAGWSTWSDGNELPVNVIDFIETTDDEDKADTGPPQDWAVYVDSGPSPNTVVVRATRPQINGYRLFFVAFQIKDGTTGSWRDLDANAGAANTTYDGSNIAHSYNSVSGILNAPSGFGNAANGDLMLIDVRSGNFNDAHCVWVPINASTLSGNNLLFPDLALVEGANANDVRVKAVRPPWDWNTEGYFGDYPGDGLSSLELWSIVNPDGSPGDISSQEFESGPISIPAGMNSNNIVGRAFYQNTYSRDHDDNVSALNESGTGYCAPITMSGNNIVTDASLAGRYSEKIFRVSLSANATLLNPSNAVCGQPLTWLIINTGSNNVYVTLDTKFRNGKAFPVPGGFLPIILDPSLLYSTVSASSTVSATGTAKKNTSAQIDCTSNLDGNLTG